jgi:small subunit ribosomal protein S1
VPDFGVFVRLEEGVEGLIHVSQLSTEQWTNHLASSKSGRGRSGGHQPDVNERKIGLSVRALRKTEEASGDGELSEPRKGGGDFPLNRSLMKSFDWTGERAMQGVKQGQLTVE